MWHNCKAAYLTLSLLIANCCSQPFSRNTKKLFADSNEIYFEYEADQEEFKQDDNEITIPKLSSPVNVDVRGIESKDSNDDEVDGEDYKQNDSDEKIPKLSSLMNVNADETESDPEYETDEDKYKENDKTNDKKIPKLSSLMNVNVKGIESKDSDDDEVDGEDYKQNDSDENIPKLSSLMNVNADETESGPEYKTDKDKFKGNDNEITIPKLSSLMNVNVKGIESKDNDHDEVDGEDYKQNESDGKTPKLSSLMNVNANETDYDQMTHDWLKIFLEEKMVGAQQTPLFGTEPETGVPDWIDGIVQKGHPESLSKSKLKTEINSEESNSEHEADQKELKQDDMETKIPTLSFLVKVNVRIDYDRTTSDWLKTFPKLNMDTKTQNRPLSGTKPGNGIPDWIKGDLENASTKSLSKSKLNTQFISEDYDRTTSDWLKTFPKLNMDTKTQNRPLSGTKPGNGIPDWIKGDLENASTKSLSKSKLNTQFISEAVFRKAFSDQKTQVWLLGLQPTNIN